MANYERFAEKSFVTKAIFDADPNKIGTEVRGIPVLDIATLREYLHENHVDIAVLTIPKQEAQAVADLLVECGVRAIWNFAHLDLKVPNHVIVESVHLSESLMQLSYRLGERG